MDKQARHLISASLLLILLAGCAPAETATPTTLPTPRQELQPTATEGEPTATVAVVRQDLENYLVVEGDMISSIAAKFNLQPETVLWANYELLFDSPDFLLTNMELIIMPVDGVYHQVGGSDTIESLAAFFGVEEQAITDWPSNRIDASTSVIFAGQWVVVPGGRRATRLPFMPNITRENMAISIEEFGTGACPENQSGGPVGDGEYAWPVESHEIQGEDFWHAPSASNDFVGAIHPGIDIKASIGENVLAADDGVVVFSGWSYLGYGYLVMLDHGNGDISFYGGLAEVRTVCGQGVRQGEIIAIAGTTGHPTGPFVHIEIHRDAHEFNEWSTKDPLDLLPN